MGFNSLFILLKMYLVYIIGIIGNKKRPGFYTQAFRFIRVIVAASTR